MIEGRKHRKSRSTAGWCWSIILLWGAAMPSLSEPEAAPEIKATSLVAEASPLPAAAHGEILPVLAGMTLFEETPPESVTPPPTPTPTESSKPLAPAPPVSSGGFDHPALPLVEPRFGGRRWSFSLALSGYYDSNLLQIPDDWDAVQAIVNPPPAPPPEPEPVPQTTPTTTGQGTTGQGTTGQGTTGQGTTPPVPPYKPEPRPDGEDYVFSVAPALAFRSIGALWHVGFNYSPSYLFYVNNDDYNGFNHALSAELAYTGPKLNAALTGSYSLTRGVNRYYGSQFLEQAGYSSGLRANYKLSPKTSIDASLSYSSTEPQDNPESDAETGSYGGTGSISANLSALWKPTPLITVGPGLRYMIQEGDLQNERTSIGPTLRLGYELGRKVNLNATVGLEFVEFGDGVVNRTTGETDSTTTDATTDSGTSDSTTTDSTTNSNPTTTSQQPQAATADDDPFVSASLGLAWAVTEHTTLNLSFDRQTSADGYLAGSYRESTGVRLGVNQRIGPTTLSLGGSYQMEDYGASSAGASTAQDMVFLTGEAGLSFPLWGDRIRGSVFYRYRDQQSDDPQRDWHGHQVGINAVIAF